MSYLPSYQGIPDGLMHTSLKKIFITFFLQIISNKNIHVGYFKLHQLKNTNLMQLKCG